MTKITLVDLINNYFKEHNLPYHTSNQPGFQSTGIIENGIWLGWIYETEFRTYDWGVNTETGIIKRISAFDPEFFTKLEAWLSEHLLILKHERETINAADLATRNC